MMDESSLEQEFLDLPSDPNAALVQFFKRMNERLDAGAYSESEYVLAMETFIEVYAPADLVVRRFSSEKISIDDISAKYFNSYISELRKVCLVEQIRLSKANSMAVFEYIRIQKEFKLEIRDLVEKVKEKIENSEVELDKKDSLMKKLNHFLHELDQSRTRIAAFSAASIQLASATGSVAKELEPAVGLMERIRKLLGTGSEDNPQLIWEARKQIEGPRKQLEDHYSE
ncbi:MAG: hypothetical protein AAF764_03490 [Pseudomonadota bacterium]